MNMEKDNKTQEPRENKGDIVPEKKSHALTTHVMPASIFSSSDSPSDDIDLREYWYIILKRRWTVGIFFLIVFISVLVGTFLQTPIFRAGTTIQIEKESSQVLNFKDVTPDERLGDKDFYVTQYELLKSHTLVQRVLDELNLNNPNLNNEAGLFQWFSDLFSQDKENSSEAKKEKESEDIQSRNARTRSFLSNLTIEPVRNSRLVKVSFDSPSPELAAEVANSIASNFIRVNLEKKYEANAYARSFLEERISQVKIKLEETEKAQVEYAKSQRIFSTEKGGDSTNAQSLQEFNTALARVQQERIKAEAIYNQLKADKSGQLPQQLENQLIQSLKSQKAKLESDYQEKLKTYKPAYPLMLQIKAQIDEIKLQIDKETESIRQSIRIAYETAKSNETMINSKLDTSKDAFLDLQSRSIQFNILKREADTNRQLYEGLLQRLKEVSAAEGMSANNIMVVDRAEVPPHQYKPDIKINALIALFIGLFGGIGLAFLFENLDNTFKSIADIEKYLGLTVLGLIPHADEVTTTQEIIKETLNNSKSKIVEAFRSTRTALQFSTATGAPKVLGMTSCFAAEGKTTASISLAIHFAQCGSSVLLVDADLRKPSIHKAFDMKNDVGLSNVLAGLVQPTAAMFKTPIKDLYLMPTGILPPNPAELMLNGRFEEFLEAASEKFDIIIIDGSPILGLADAVVLANLVDKLLLVVEAGVTPRAMAKAALKRLRAVNVTPLGVIFNKMKNDPLGYGYDYYYYYAHGYYGENNPDPNKKKSKSKKGSEAK